MTSQNCGVGFFPRLIFILHLTKLRISDKVLQATHLTYRYPAAVEPQQNKAHDSHLEKVARCPSRDLICCLLCESQVDIPLNSSLVARWCRITTCTACTTGNLTLEMNCFGAETLWVRCWHSGCGIILAVFSWWLVTIPWWPASRQYTALTIGWVCTYPQTGRLPEF